MTSPRGPAPQLISQNQETLDLPLHRQSPGSLGSRWRAPLLAGHPLLTDLIGLGGWPLQVSSRGQWGPTQFSSVQSLSHGRLFVTPWTAACQVSLSITNTRCLLKFVSIESVMPSNHLIFCCPLPLLPSILPSTRVFSNESALHIRWPRFWSFSFSISPSDFL